MQNLKTLRLIATQSGPAAEPIYSEDQALDALAVWEALLDMREDLWAFKFQEYGVGEMRAFCLEQLTPLINDLFDARCFQGWDGLCFDWDYVPAALEVLAVALRDESNDSLEALAAKIDSLGEQI